MAVASTDEFVSLVKRSGLITDDQLQSFLARSVLPPEDPLAMAGALSDAGLVTPWQREKLLEGRFKGFFLGKYKVLDQLGAGAMGNVFLAEHRVMRHRVAIKTLAKRLVGNDTYIRRFEQEARAAAAINHPRVVRAFDFDSTGDVYFLVMEYVEGEDLAKIVLRDGVLPIPVAAECIRQTAEGLAAAHEGGLIHRDIKPSNLLVDKQGNIRILDLGLARLIDDDAPSLTLVTDSKMIGTVDYLAPEQARNSHHIDHRADLYSLGCTFYFLLCGHPPFDEGTLTQRVIEHQTKKPVDIRQRRRDCPAELAFICHKLLAKTPGERFQTAQEVVEALGEWLQCYKGIVGGSVDPAKIAPTSLRRAASESRAGSAGGSESELQLVPSGDTLDGIRAAASTAGSGGGLDDGDLALVDDDALVGPRPGAAPSPSGPGRTAARKPGSSVSGASKGSGSGGSGSNAGASRPDSAAASGRDSALELPSPAPLPSQDSLVQLLGEQLPDALVSAKPKSNPLGLADDFQLSPLDAAPEERTKTSAAAEAYLRAAAASQPKPASWRERIQALVSEEGPGGIAYSLWFLIFSGMVLGLIVCVVGYAYHASTKELDVPKTRSFESRRE
ncbi:MAG TPA: serine/threonine-protein kinase [Pirellulaceae bacterium]|nr:serine/threonine-protein kinase [Pirellulaceae bacterium]